MKSEEVLQRLKNAVSEEEYQKLSDHTLPHINEFNRSTILEMLEHTSVSEEDIPEERICALRDILKQYLKTYLPEQKNAWKWIILSCIYLGFLCHRPLHPQNMVRYSVVHEDGEQVYYCPAKAEEKNTACSFCVCRKKQ